MANGLASQTNNSKVRVQIPPDSGRIILTGQQYSIRILLIKTNFEAFRFQILKKQTTPKELLLDHTPHRTRLFALCVQHKYKYSYRRLQSGSTISELTFGIFELGGRADRQARPGHSLNAVRPRNC